MIVFLSKSPARQLIFSFEETKIDAKRFVSQNGQIYWQSTLLADKLPT